MNNDNNTTYTDEKVIQVGDFYPRKHSITLTMGIEFGLLCVILVVLSAFFHILMNPQQEEVPAIEVAPLSTEKAPEALSEEEVNKALVSLSATSSGDRLSDKDLKNALESLSAKPSEVKK